MNDIANNSLQKARSRVTRAFKIRGLTIQSEALDAVLNVIRREEASEADRMLHEIIDEVKIRLMESESNASQLVVTTHVLADVVAEWSRDSTDVVEEALQLLDAFHTPKLTFDNLTKQFKLIPAVIGDGKTSFFGDANDKIDMFLQRYYIIQQRILRNDHFRPKLVNDDADEVLQITPIEGLLGRTGTRLLLGMLRQIDEGKYHVEDNTSIIRVDLSHVKVKGESFVVENGMYLIQGELVDGIFRVDKLGPPILETRGDSINSIGLQTCDIFGAFPSLSEFVKVQEEEISHGDDGTFLLLSDVHLDNPMVLLKLEKLFDGFQHSSPLPVFIFMGNFTSKPFSTSLNSYKTMIGYYEELGNVISKFPSIAKNGRFILIPGPNDPGIGHVLPRQPIPEYISSSLRAKVHRISFATNPCRIRYFSKEFVFFRHDMMNKFQQHGISFSNQHKSEAVDIMDDCVDVTTTNHNSRSQNEKDHETSKRLFSQMVHTILHQSHLCPLPEVASPIYWQLDHVMRLYPIPDALIIGDRTEQMYENYGGCDVMNPGSFTQDFSFVMYRPIGENSTVNAIKADVEFSQID